MQSGASANNMRLGDYFALLRRHWVAVLLCLVLAIGGAVAYLLLAPKEYRSTASVLVTKVEQNNGGGNQANVINLDTEAQLVTATQTVSAAAEELEVTSDEIRELADRVGVSVPPNTEILDITYTGDSAEAAQQGALAFANAYLAQREATARKGIEDQIATLDERSKAFSDQLAAASKAAASQPAGSAERTRTDQQIQQLSQQLASNAATKTRLQSTSLTPGQIVTQPRLPSSPSSPDLITTLATGLALGLLLGIGVAALRHRADDVIRTPEDLYRRTRVPVATVLSTPLHQGEVTVLPPLSADGRGYARLRNLVTTSLEESSRRVVIVAGVRRGGGPVAANLAASLARSGEEVVLLCADVFGSTAGALFADPPREGIAELLAGERQIDSVARRLPAVPSLRIIGLGRDPDRADALLQTRSPRKLIDQLLQTASFVVIEASATTNGPDAQTLANVAELAVLVVESAETTAREVLDACAQLESMHTAVLGAVIARYGRDSDVKTRAAAKDDDAAAGGATDDTAAERVEPLTSTRPVPEATGNGATGNGAAGNGAAGNGAAASNGVPHHGVVGNGHGSGGDGTGVRPAAGGDEPTGSRPVPPDSRGPLAR
jgi:capsular polysaccharide biosynthesis protein/MinD-like ATPase involved in chromosome partitioning or flagellar assembly